MLLPARIAQGVRDGTITLAFRRWEQPRVRVGGTQLTSVGIVGFPAVEEVLDPAELTETDARAAGFSNLDALRRQLYPPITPDPDPDEPAPKPVPEEPAPKPVSEEPALKPVPEEVALRPSRRAGPRSSKGGDHVYRIRLVWLGEDPRVQLRDRIPDAVDLAELTAAVARLDAGKRTGPWTRPILEWVRDHPGVISTELAALLGRDLQPMKADIRRLKALGLTESLRVGYRLSPRGRAYLESLG